MLTKSCSDVLFTHYNHSQMVISDYIRLRFVNFRRHMVKMIVEWAALLRATLSACHQSMISCCSVFATISKHGHVLKVGISAQMEYIGMTDFTGGANIWTDMLQKDHEIPSL